MKRRASGCEQGSMPSRLIGVHQRSKTRPVLVLRIGVPAGAA
jgi:hypothetical protein